MQEIGIERNRSGKPYAGKVFAAVHAHVSDVPYFAFGEPAKSNFVGIRKWLGKIGILEFRRSFDGRNQPLSHRNPLLGIGIIRLVPGGQKH